MTPEDLSATENEIIRLWEAGEIPYLTHMAGGNERILVDLFKTIKPTDWVFASHRCHHHWLLHHKDAEFFNRNLGEVEGTLPPSVAHGAKQELIERVLEGKSMFLYGPRFICSAIVAGTASIAAGMALSIKRRLGSERVYCFLGDGAEDEGNFYEAVRLVHGRNLPAIFIIEDNDASCGVTHAQRGSPEDWNWPNCVIRYHYTPKYPHAGTFVRPNLKWKPK